MRIHNRTPYIIVNTRKCTACGQCVEACPQGILKIVGFLRHRHVHVGRPSDCAGCFACVDVCATGAIRDGRAVSGI